VFCLRGDPPLATAGDFTFKEPGIFLSKNYSLNRGMVISIYAEQIFNNPLIKKTMKSNSRSKSTTAKKSSTKNSSKTKESSSSDDSSAFRELFVEELKDIYWAEKALVKALPKVASKVSNEELKEALENHLSETEEQVARLEQVFEVLGEKAEGKKCEAMQGLIKESEEVISDTEEGPVRDAGIILAAQKIEHYEIATYGTLCTFAKILGENEASALLEDTLNEEKTADETLSQIAESVVNMEALEEQEQDQEEEE
jgi:ferritin-like metal-binding protein YciE